MLLFRAWLGPIVRDLFNGVFEVINGLLLMSMHQLKKCTKKEHYQESNLN